MKRRHRSGGGGLTGPIVLFVLLAVLPLAILTFSSVHLASGAVAKDAESRVDQIGDLATSIVQEDLQSLSAMVLSFADRPNLVAVLRPSSHDDPGALQEYLEELQSSHSGLDTVLLADPQGRIVTMVPSNPELIGSDLGYLDWYREATSVGRPPISRAFLNPWSGDPVAVAVTALVHGPSEGSTPGEDLGTLIAVYNLAEIREVVDTFASSEEVEVAVTDQRGVVVAAPGTKLTMTVPRLGDPGVVAALHGDSTVDASGSSLTAYVPVRRLGWTVIASVRKQDALAGVQRVRSTVFAVAAMLGLVLLAGLLIVIRALWGRRRAEEQSRELQRFLESVVENIPNMIFVKEANELRFVRFNRAGEELLGYSREELLGRNDHDFFPPEEADFFAAKDREVLEVGRLVDIPEEQIETANGMRILHTQKIPIVDEEGGPRYLLGISEDITEHKQMERAIRESEERYRLLVETAPDMVFTLSPEGMFTSLNLGFEKITGWRRQDWIGRGFGPLIHPDDLETVRSRVGRMASGERLPPVQVRMATISGGWRSVESVSSPIIKDGSTVEIVGIVRDITERKRTEDEIRRRRAEAERAREEAEGAREEAERAKDEAEHAKDQAEQASRAKSEFLSRMSHELRTPLNAVLGFGQLLEMDNLNDEQREGVAQILKGGRHLLDLINEVLDIARIEVGRIALSVEPVAVEDAVLGAVALIRPLASERGIRVVTEVPSSLGFVTADRQRLRQVLLNLLSNAVKYNRPDGSVTIRCAPGSAGSVLVQVIDDGPGIPQELVGRLFTPFDRLGAETSAVEGTGLGLALSKRLVEVMGGTLEVDTGPGRGSTFTVCLPGVESPEARYERDEARGMVLAAVNGEGTLLHIEDNPANLKLIERILSGLRGVKLLSAMQGTLGLDLARQHRPDVILLDLNLPDLRGQEVLGLLRSDPRTRDIPVLVVSADATPEQLRTLRAAGARAYLTKPLDVHRFLQVVSDVLSERRLGHAG